MSVGSDPEAVDEVIHERLGKLTSQRLVGQRQPVIAGTPQLVDDDLRVDAETDLAASLSPGKGGHGQSPAGTGV